MTDVGLQLVDSLYRQLMIDDEWSVRRERGFTWWSYRLAQHVEVGPPVWTGDRHVCSVRIWTDIARDVAPATDPAVLLSQTNMHATLSALVFDDEAGTVFGCATAQIHDGIFDWMSKVLATAMIVQNYDAHIRVEAIAEACEGHPAETEHPISGERSTPDEILGVPQTLIVGEGAAPSRFAGPKMAAAQHFLAQAGYPGTADETGLTCEVPFVADGVGAPVGEAQTALVQVLTDVEHPDAGSGALVLLRLPLTTEPTRASGIANELNLAEARGESSAPLFGAWCPDPMSLTTICFCHFIPNALAGLTRMDNVVAYQASRARFAAQLLAARGEPAAAEPGTGR